MSAEGIEPSTNGLKGRCSAIELRARNRAKGILTRRKVSVNGKPCFTAKFAKIAKKNF